MAKELTEILEVVFNDHSVAQRRSVPFNVLGGTVMKLLRWLLQIITGWRQHSPAMAVAPKPQPKGSSPTQPTGSGINPPVRPHDWQ